MANNQKTSIVDEKITHLKSDCDNLYNQITELRTTVQEIYGEIAESDRFFTIELLRLSERLEHMSKDISGITKSSGNAPESIVVKVNPTTNINPTMNNTQATTEDQCQKDTEPVSIIDKKAVSISIAIFLGFFIAIGTLFLFAYKIMSILQVF